MQDELTPEGAVEEPAAVEPADDAGADAGPQDNREAPPTWEYVDKLRKESAGYRTKASSYEDAFGRYSDDDRTTWLQLAKTVYDDPKAGASWLSKIAEGLQQGMTEEQAVDAAGAEPGRTDEPAGDDKPMTRAELESWYAERRAAESAQAEQASLIRGIHDEAEKLGYKDGSMEFNDLLFLASKPEDQGGTGGDLSKAHEVLEARKQAIVDAYVAEQRNGGRTPVAPKGGVPAAGGEARQIKSLADSHRAAAARIAGIREGGGLLTRGGRGRG